MIVTRASYRIFSCPSLEQLKLLEQIVRVAYQSQDKTTNTSWSRLLGKVIGYGHESVLEHLTISVEFTVDRGISHQLVRHRIASFTQESTRYCNYSRSGDVTFIKPCFFNENQLSQWREHMSLCEDCYLNLLKSGATPEEARTVLPSSLKTTIVVTANLREWRHIFSLRTAKSAHPQMREIMLPLLKELQERVPVIFSDLPPATLHETSNKKDLEEKYKVQSEVEYTASTSEHQAVKEAYKAAWIATNEAFEAALSEAREVYLAAYKELLEADSKAEYEADSKAAYEISSVSYETALQRIKKVYDTACETAYTTCIEEHEAQAAYRSENN